MCMRDLQVQSVMALGGSDQRWTTVVEINHGSVSKHEHATVAMLS